ncbi:hypothetical protein AMELA_G00165270, partial [Ameiurus melas]
MKHIEEEEECSTSLLEMAYIIARLIPAAMLICLNSASPFLTEYRKTRDYNGEHSQGLQNDHTTILFYCDSESVIIGVSPTRYTDVYLQIDDWKKTSISQLLEECSHVELQSTSLVRIFYKGCSLQNWLGHEKQYTVKLGDLNEDTIQTQTCPSSTAGSIQVPAVKCESANMIVTLAAKELKEARFLDLDASSLKEKIMTEKNGLTQWKDGENLVVQVENPMKEQDPAVLLLQYTDIMDKLNMAKVFCPQQHPKWQTERKIHTKKIHKDSDKIHHALKSSEYSEFQEQPPIQWAMPVFMSEEYRPSPRLTISNKKTPTVSQYTTVQTTMQKANPTISAAIIIDTELGTATTSTVATKTSESTSHHSTTICAGTFIPRTERNSTSFATQQAVTSASISETNVGSKTTLPISIFSPETNITETAMAKAKVSSDIPETTRSTDTIMMTSTVSVPTKTAAVITVSASTSAQTHLTLTITAETQTPPQHKATTTDIFGNFWGRSADTKHLTTQTSTQTVGKQTTAENPSNCNNETVPQSGTIPASTENILVTSTAATSTHASIISSANTTINATTNVMNTSTEPGTSSSTNKELYTTDAATKTPSAADHFTANTIPVNYTLTTITSTQSLNTTQGTTKTAAANVNTNTEAKTNSTIPLNMIYSETNTTAWTSATTKQGRTTDPPVTGPATTTTKPFAVMCTDPAVTGPVTTTTPPIPLMPTAPAVTGPVTTTTTPIALMPTAPAVIGPETTTTTPIDVMHTDTAVTGPVTTTTTPIALMATAPAVIGPATTTTTPIAVMHTDPAVTGPDSTTTAPIVLMATAPAVTGPVTTTTTPIALMATAPAVTGTATTTTTPIAVMQADPAVTGTI